MKVKEYMNKFAEFIAMESYGKSIPFSYYEPDVPDVMKERSNKNDISIEHNNDAG